MTAVIFVISIILFLGAFAAMAHAKRQGDPDAGAAMVAYPTIIAFATGLFVYAYFYVWRDRPIWYDMETLYSVTGLFMVANLATIWRFAFVSQPRLEC